MVERVQVSLPLSVIADLGLKTDKDPKNTVMVKPFREIDIRRIYLPVPDFFK